MNRGWNTVRETILEIGNGGIVEMFNPDDSGNILSCDSESLRIFASRQCEVSARKRYCSTRKVSLRQRWSVYGGSVDRQPVRFFPRPAPVLDRGTRGWFTALTRFIPKGVELDNGLERGPLAYWAPEEGPVCAEEIITLSTVTWRKITL